MPGIFSGSDGEELKMQLNDIEKNALSEPIEWRFSSFMPTLLDLVTFMYINHESMHLGQLAAWRRAMD